MAAGEAASCLGARREPPGLELADDLVVFGRACAIKAGEVVDPKSANPDLNPVSVEQAMDRFDGLRHAKGAAPTAQIRASLQKAMQDDAAVFRTSKTLKEGCDKVSRVYALFDDVAVTDRSR